MDDRNPVYDIMKGIGIILMLVGHIPPGQRLFHFIYSFHMPLFFIVAGFFASTAKLDAGVVRKYASRLLLPVMATMAIIILLSPLSYFAEGNFNYTVARVLSLLWAGDALPTRFGLLSLEAMWFLVALFWAKCLFQVSGYLVNKSFTRHPDEILLGLCFVLSSVAIVCHRYIPYVPWGLMKGVSAIWFLAMGWYAQHHRLPVWVWIVSVLCWLASLGFGELDMSTYTYKFYPLELLGAVGATWLVYLLSKVIKDHTVWTARLLRWFGVNSLLILCVNTLDRRSYLVRAIKGLLDFHPAGLYNTAVHYTIGLALVIALIYIPYTNRLFGARKWRELA